MQKRNDFEECVKGPFTENLWIGLDIASNIFTTFQNIGLIYFTVTTTAIGRTPLNHSPIDVMSQIIIKTWIKKKILFYLWGIGQKLTALTFSKETARKPHVSPNNYGINSILDSTLLLPSTCMVNTPSSNRKSLWSDAVIGNFWKNNVIFFKLVYFTRWTIRLSLTRKFVWLPIPGYE